MSENRWSPNRMTRSRTAAVGASVALLIVAGAGAAYAADSSGSTTASSAAPSTTVPASSGAHSSGRAAHPSGAGFGMRGMGMGFGGGVVHGVYTVRNRTGGYQTVEVQSGTVTAVSSTSITLKSADGYSHTYAVTSSTEVDSQAAGIATVAKGDSVTLMATTASGKDTASSISDVTKIGSSRQGFGFGGMRGGPGFGPRGANGAGPSGSSSSSGPSSVPPPAA